MAINDKEFYTIKEFAQKIGLHPTTIRMAIKKGKLNAFKMGANTSKYCIPCSELTRLCLENKLKSFKG